MVPSGVRTLEGPGESVGVVLGAPRHRSVARRSGDRDRDLNAPTDQRAWSDRLHPSSLLPARVVPRPPTFPPGPVNGAWWPRSDDLSAELPVLVAAFDLSWGRVTRMTAHRSAWCQAPCELPVSGHPVRAAWLASGFDPYAIRLLAYGVGRRDLLIVPPDAGTATAERLMTAAADPVPRLTASALLAEAQDRDPARDM